MAYSELFKNYSDIRNFMRRFYVYGFEKRQDFTAKSSRSYDDNRRRLDSWLEDYMSFKSEADGRAYRISFDSSSISHNPLYKSWKAKSFTSMDITLHFYLLDILADGKAYSAAELLELLSGRYFNCFDNQLRQPDESTVRNKLNEYTVLGMLRLVKQGRRNLYCLAQDEVNWRSWQLACAFFPRRRLWERQAPICWINLPRTAKLLPLSIILFYIRWTASCCTSCWRR